VFCNKYLEIIKPFIADASTKDEYLTVANTIFKNILIILHPYCPFVTEKIYSNLFAAKKSIMLETFPDKIALKNKKISKELTAFLDIHAFAKDLRIKNGIANSKTIHLNIISNANYDLKLINADANRFNITIDKLLTTADSSLSEIKLFSACSLEYIPDVVDQEKEKNKLTEQLKKIEFEIERSKQILSNKNFVEHAPKEKVNEEKEKAKQYKEQYDSISKILLQINKNK
jgi:valyl-tRNA synthetase